MNPVLCLAGGSWVFPAAVFPGDGSGIALVFPEKLANWTLRRFPVGMRVCRSLVLPVFVFVLASCANYNKKDPFMITLHMEGSAIEGSGMVFPEPVGYPPSIRHFSVTPELTHKQVVAYYPFRAEDDRSNGAVLVFGDPGQRRLFSVTSTNQGKLLLVKVDGRTADYLMVDRPVRDGMVVVGQGISDEIMALFDLEDLGWEKLREPPFGPPEAETQQDLFDPLLR